MFKRIRLEIIYGVCIIFYTSMSLAMNNKKRCALEPCKEEITVTSPAFIKNGGKIDIKHAAQECGGHNIPFDVNWSPITEAKSYIVIVDDPDAPNSKNPRPKPFVHAVFFDISATTMRITKSTITTIGKAGTNDFGNQRFDGPCPPVGSGPHRYFIKVYALNVDSLGLQQGASKEQVLEKAHNHIIGQGQIFGIYER